MKRAVAVALVATVAILWMGWANHRDEHLLRYYKQHPAQLCYEDQPCWDCSTMGNYQCGPLTAAK